MNAASMTPVNMPFYGQIIVACWVVFIGYWLVSALATKATTERGSFVSMLWYRVPLAIGGILIGKLRGWDNLMGLPLTPDSEATRYAGACVCVAGLAIAVWARWTLGGNWSSGVTFKQDHQLVTRGPYRFVRHPIYTGVLVMCSTQAIQFGRLHFWLGFLVIGIGLWIKLKQEETVMLGHFPEYSDYRKRVKALLPFVI